MHRSGRNSPSYATQILVRSPMSRPVGAVAKRAKLYHLMSWGVPFLAWVIPFAMGFIGPAGTALHCRAALPLMLWTHVHQTAAGAWCWITVKADEEFLSWTLRFAAFYGIVFLDIVIVAVLQVMTAVAVVNLLRPAEGARSGDGSVSTPKAHRGKAKQAAARMILFAVVFFCVYVATCVCASVVAALTAATLQVDACTHCTGCELDYRRYPVVCTLRTAATGTTSCSNVHGGPGQASVRSACLHSQQRGHLVRAPPAVEAAAVAHLFITRTHAAAGTC